MEGSTPRAFSFLDSAGAPGDSSLDEDLEVLVASLSAAVPSLCAVEVVLTRNGYPVVLTVWRGPPTEPDATPGAYAARTSLRLPLGLLRPGFEPGSHVVFYARVPGALVDLAADATHVLGRDGIVLDDDLPPRYLTDGVGRAAELMTIERAHGVLIERGHHPADVASSLRRQAAVAGLEPYAFAMQVVATAHREAPA